MPLPLTIIAPRGPFAALAPGELWAHRGLLGILMRRDLAVRYRQTVLGIAWAVLQPALLALAFALVASRFGVRDQGGMPYWLFALAGLCAWMPFAHAMVHASASLVENERLITRVWFPRALLPLSAVAGGAVDALVAATLIPLALLATGHALSWTLLLLPLVLAAPLLVALAAGLWLSALNARFRDVRYVLPFLSQALLLASPVAWPLASLPDPLRGVAACNPLAGAIELVRWAALGGAPPDPATLAASAITGLILLLGGALWFSHAERQLVDRI